MGKRVSLGQITDSMNDIDDTPPVGPVGIDMSTVIGQMPVDKWLVTMEHTDENTRASLDLDTISIDLDTIVRSAIYLGSEGNAITVAMQADSGVGEGVTIEEDLDLLTVVIHVESGVSTVLQVEAAIGATSTLIEVMTPGTAATILDATDAFTATHLAGGLNNASIFDVYLWGRHAITKRWGRYHDIYGNVFQGQLIDGADVGRHHAVVRDIGIFDRVYFTRDAAGAGVVNVHLTEIDQAGG